MKKFAKMSLVAAVAVAGFSTTASAKALEDAIKNVDVSGTMVYRYDDRSSDDTNVSNITNNSYKINLNLKSKVNDDVTANVKVIVGNQAKNQQAELAATDGGADGNADVSVSQVYFGYTGIANTTVNIGKQALATPFTVANDSMGNEHTGSGILALTNVGPATFAAGYFNNNNITDVGSKNIWTVAAMANVGPVALDAWYLDLDENFDIYTIGAKSSFNIDAVKLTIGARHTAADFENAITENDNSLTKIDLSAKMGIFGAAIGYGWTDKEGGYASPDSDAKTAYQGWAMDLNNVADASLLKTNVNVDVMPNLNVALNYNILDMGSNTANDSDGKVRADTKDKEYYTQITYKMSKNFSGYFRLGKTDTERHSDKGTRGRLHVTYSF